MEGRDAIVVCSFQAVDSDTEYPIDGNHVLELEKIKDEYISYSSRVVLSFKFP